MSNHLEDTTEVILDCPYCPAHKQSKLAFNIDKGVFNCFRCEFKGTLTFLRYHHPDLYERVKDLVSLSVFTKLKNYNPYSITSESIKLELNGVSFLEPDDKYYNYLLSRGWDDISIRNYAAMKSDEPGLNNRVILPVIDDNNTLVYYTARDITGKNKRKYMNPEADKTFIFKSITSLDSVYSDTAFICEGVFDAFKLPNACALLGKTLNKKQHNTLYKFLKSKKFIYICLDPGTKQQCDTLASELSLWFPNKDIHIMNWVSTTEDIDIGDLSKSLTTRELVSYVKENSYLT